MQAASIQWILKITAFTLLLASIGWLGELVFPGPWFHRHFWSVLLFFALLTGVTGLLALRLMRSEMFHSVSVILGTTVLRLLLSIGFVFLILLPGDENLLWFVIDFFLIYLLYLLFDMYGLISNLRLHSK
ncbi:hypothetical protein [Cyclobacterium xiamenense]|jgi:hypothetical protein|uniref:hypothetical protein n=1 Tax=Cyclobacterium xiamenense TaxID=1297121 RepID=UPI0035D11A85